MEVEKISRVLEDISVKDPIQAVHKEVQLPPVPTSLNSDSDSEINGKTFRLLELVAEYEQIAGGTWLNYVNGHLNLSRANYSGKRFGQESWDLRPYNALKTVKSEAEGYRLETNEIHRKKKRNASSEPEPKDEVKDDVVEEKEEEKTENDQKLKNRKATPKNEHGDSESSTSGVRVRKDESSKGDSNKKGITEEKLPQEEEEGPFVKDPMAQFGTLVPYQLRQAQKNFVDGLDGSVRLLNLSREISNLVDQIEKLNAI